MEVARIGIIILRRPIELIYELCENGYLVYDDDDMEYGLGNTEGEAFVDYIDSLACALRSLRKDRDDGVLHKSLLELLAKIESYIELKDVGDDRRSGG